MKFDGIAYDYLEESGSVKEAIVTAHRIAISWEQGGEDWQIVATSQDGCLYRGVLTSGGPSPECVVELSVFKAKTGAALVFGFWRSIELGNSYQFVFRLFPSSQPKAPSAKKLRLSRGTKRN